MTKQKVEYSVTNLGCRVHRWFAAEPRGLVEHIVLFTVGETLSLQSHERQKNWPGK